MRPNQVYQNCCPQLIHLVTPLCLLPVDLTPLKPFEKALGLQGYFYKINFDLSVVQRDTVTGRLEYRSTGINSGTCTLTCHGFPHSPLSYGLGVGGMMTSPARVPPMRSLPPPTVTPRRR